MEEDIDAAGQAAPELPDDELPDDELPDATGEPRVDEALRRLDGLGDLPVSGHPPIFERVHASLVDVLGELRSGVGDDAGRRVDPQH